MSQIPCTKEWTHALVGLPVLGSAISAEVTVVNSFQKRHQEEALHWFLIPDPWEWLTSIYFFHKPGSSSFPCILWDSSYFPLISIFCPLVEDTVSLCCLWPRALMHIPLTFSELCPILGAVPSSNSMLVYPFLRAYIAPSLTFPVFFLLPLSSPEIDNPAHQIFWSRLCYPQFIYCSPNVTSLKR